MGGLKYLLRIKTTSHGNPTHTGNYMAWKSLPNIIKLRRMETIATI